MEKKLPVGIQSFEKIRNDNFLYVDKTDYVYQLVHNNVPYFLSRPRRFGKSLLLSTMKAYWEGKRELFKGLKIEKLEEENPDAWKPYPVFYFDFNGEEYENVGIEEMLDQHLSEWEEIYGNQYHKVSIFSDLNQLTDISLSNKYAGVCGITEEELKSEFGTHIERLAEVQTIAKEECLKQLKQTYDGYYFHPSGVGVYNPYSLLNCFFNEEFGSYWFETGTPTFLVKKLKDTIFDVRKFTDRTLYASEGMLKDYTGDSLDPVPLLYQTGYLTIADFDRVGREYTLAFPNEEVKYGFVECLMPEYVADCGAGSGNDIFTLRRYIENGDLESTKNVLTSLFANITYTLESDPFEHYFQTVIYLVFTLLKKFVRCEMHTFTGRIDCVVETRNYIYVFEFKRDDTAENALNQIDSKDYALPFVADSRKLYKIGVSFDSETRKLIDWKVAQGVQRGNHLSTGCK